MNADQSQAETLNERLAVRGALFAAPWFSSLLADIYGTKLTRVASGEGIAVAHIKTLPWRRRAMLAPFNFQPALRDDGERAARAVIGIAESVGASAVIRLHHALAPACVSALGLDAVSDSVESLVDLTGGFEAVVARARPRRRSQMRQSQAACSAQGVVVGPAESSADFDAYFDVMQRAYRDKHRMITQPRALFARMFARADAARLYIARDRGGAVMGGIFVLMDETQWLYGWGANDPAGEALGLTSVLLARAMEDAAEKVSLFSLGASPLTHETLRQFKRSWGAQEHNLLTYHWKEPARAVDLHSGFPLARTLIGYTPLPVLSLASRVAVRWLV